MFKCFLESLLSEFFPSLGVTVHLALLGCTVLISGPAVEAAQILILFVLASNVHSYQN